MASKLFVGGLAYAVTDDQLEELFASVGTVASAKVIIDRDMGRSKGFGFVEMSTDDEAKAAIDQLNGREFEGRTISVSEARPQEQRERSFDNNRGGGYNNDRRGGFGGGRRY